MMALGQRAAQPEPAVRRSCNASCAARVAIVNINQLAMLRTHAAESPHRVHHDREKGSDGRDGRSGPKSAADQECDQRSDGDLRQALARLIRMYSPGILEKNSQEFVQHIGESDGLRPGI